MYQIKRTTLYKKKNTNIKSLTLTARVRWRWDPACYPYALSLAASCVCPFKAAEPLYPPLGSASPVDKRVRLVPTAVTTFRGQIDRDNRTDPKDNRISVQLRSSERVQENKILFVFLCIHFFIIICITCIGIFYCYEPRSLIPRHYYLYIWTPKCVLKNLPTISEICNSAFCPTSAPFTFLFWVCEQPL